MSTFQKHLAAINAGSVTKSNVIGLRKGLNAWERASYGGHTSRTNPGFTTQEADALTQAIWKMHPTVTGELHESGLSVLRNPRYAKRWSAAQQATIDKACRFDLIRFDWIGSRGANCVPVYRVIARDGSAFCFRNIPWQSAWTMGEESGPVIVREHVA